MKENDLKEIIEPTTELTAAEIINILNDEKSEDCWNTTIYTMYVLVAL